MTDLGLFLTQIQQKNIRVIQAIRGKKSATNYRKLPQTTHQQKTPIQSIQTQFTPILIIKEYGLKNVAKKNSSDITINMVILI